MKLFLDNLLSTGQPVIDIGGAQAEEWMTHQLALPEGDCLSLLEARHASEALFFPGALLPFHPAAALWALRIFFKASCYYLFREIETSEITRNLAEPFPATEEPAAHLSADLLLRHLPKLIQLAQTTAEDDPLVLSLKSIAAQAPYSAPGYLTPQSELDPLFRNPALAQSWLEKLLQADIPLPEDARVASLLSQLAGQYPEQILPPRYQALALS